MELYTLDGLFRRSSVVDRFESLIWTERFTDIGDFELVLPSTAQNKNLLAADTLLAMNESKRVMKVETIENKEDSSGNKKLYVKGPELSNIFKERTSLTFTAGSKEGTYAFTGSVRGLMETLFAYSAGPLAVLEDRIPFITTGSLYPESTIPYPDVIGIFERDIADLYSELKTIGEMFELGFRLYRGMDNQAVYFNIYSGNNRTSEQTTLAPVIFSPGLDSLQNVTDYTSIANSKNVARVIGKDTTAFAYASGASSTTSGLARRVLTVRALDVAGTDAAAISTLVRIGEEELAKYLPLSAFDGEVTKLSPYKYGVDYDLGDLVEMRNDEGITNQMKVTEQIFVSDTEGERSYPTLSSRKLITPGSWLAWDFNQDWADAVGTWSEA